MGAAGSVEAGAKPYESVEAAKAAGVSQEDIDAYLKANPDAAGAAPAAAETPAAAATAETPAAEGSAKTTYSENTDQAAAEAEAEAAAPEAAAAAAAGGGADAVDRSGIERNANGSEEPSSADPELWNVDGTEVDYLVKYKVGGQMWYVQSRMRENPVKGQPIPGFPMNKKATDAKRYYKMEKDDGSEEEFNTENDQSTHWKKEWQQPPA